MGSAVYFGCMQVVGEGFRRNVGDMLSYIFWTQVMGCFAMVFEARPNTGERGGFRSSVCVF